MPVANSIAVCRAVGTLTDFLVVRVDEHAALRARRERASARHLHALTILLWTLHDNHAGLDVQQPGILHVALDCRCKRYDDTVDCGHLRRIGFFNGSGRAPVRVWPRRCRCLGRDERTIRLTNHRSRRPVEACIHIRIDKTVHNRACRRRSRRVVCRRKREIKTVRVSDERKSVRYRERANGQCGGAIVRFKVVTNLDDAVLHVQPAERRRHPVGGAQTGPAHAEGLRRRNRDALQDVGTFSDIDVHAVRHVRRLHPCAAARLADTATRVRGERGRRGGAGSGRGRNRHRHRIARRIAFAAAGYDDLLERAVLVQDRVGRRTRAAAARDLHLRCGHVAGAGIRQRDFRDAITGRRAARSRNSTCDAGLNRNAAALRVNDDFACGGIHHAIDVRGLRVLDEGERSAVEVDAAVVARVAVGREYARQFKATAVQVDGCLVAASAAAHDRKIHDDAPVAIDRERGAATRDAVVPIANVEALVPKVKETAINVDVCRLARTDADVAVWVRRHCGSARRDRSSGNVQRAVVGATSNGEEIGIPRTQRGHAAIDANVAVLVGGAASLEYAI